MDKLRLGFFSTSNRDHAGFTLVEVLVAVAVSGILIAAVTALLMAGLNVQKLALSEGGFAVNAQRLLNQMVDGTEGLIGAKEIVSASEGIISYKVGASSITITYQLTDGSIARTRDGVSTVVLTGVERFSVSQTLSTIELAIEGQNPTDSTTSVYRTSVVPRNI